jgi:nitrogen fixation protein NifU and related proteins
VSAGSAASASLSAMYQDVILTHYRKPNNKRELSSPTGQAERKNPLCGDEVLVAVLLRDGIIVDAAFTGRCCSITQASASMMTGAVIGGSVRDAALRAAEVDAVLHGRETVDDASSLGDLAALRGVAPFPARVACAMLPWLALRDALAEGDS